MTPADDRSKAIPVTPHARPSPPPARTARHGRPGFTLVELLIATSIIVLLLALSLPAFRAITGGRSIEGATNQVSSMLGRARADAVGLQLPRGVAFYTDATGQCKMAEVGPVTYVPWGGNNTPYSVGQYVSASGAFYVCKRNVLANTGTLANLPSATSPTADNTYWHVFVDAGGNPVPASTAVVTDAYHASDPYFATAGLFFDQIPDTDPIPLPLGIAAQVIADNSSGNVVGPSTITRTTDGYLHDGVILFDASGRMVYQSFVLSSYGLIGTAIALTNSSTNVALNVAINATTSPPLPNVGGTKYAVPQPLPSSFGLVLYDRESHDNQNFPPHDPELDPNVSYGSTGASPPSAADEEAWLDVNATPLLINRYTGTLVRGE